MKEKGALMKRHSRANSSAASSATRFFENPPVTGPSASAIEDLQRVLKKGARAQPPAPIAEQRFQVIAELSDAELPPSDRVRLAIVAGNLREEAELKRLKPTVERLASPPGGRSPFLLVAGLNADRVARTAVASELRRTLEDLGAVFVERPPEADTAESLGAFLEREYAPDEAFVAAALAPPPPITVLEDQDITPYLQARPDIAGDRYFLSHKPASELKKR